MEIAPKISVNMKIHFGRPGINGMCVAVDLTISKLAGGMTTGKILK